MGPICIHWPIRGHVGDDVRMQHPLRVPAASIIIIQQQQQQISTIPL